MCVRNLKIFYMFILMMWLSIGNAQQIDYTQKIVEFEDSGEVEVKGPGDFSHQSDSFTSNFRLREGETEIIKVEPGDRLHIEKSTLPPKD